MKKVVGKEDMSFVIEWYVIYDKLCEVVEEMVFEVVDFIIESEFDKFEDFENE